jgi:hypothetical protein
MEFGDPRRRWGGPSWNYLSIYVDFEFEQVMFRWDHKKKKYFRKFYDGEETPVSEQNKLCFAGFNYGEEITKEHYEKGKPLNHKWRNKLK